MKKIAFLDRDGALIFEPGADADPPFQVDAISKLQILDGVVEAALELQKRGYELVMVTNQNGVGTPSFPTEDFELPQAELLKRLEAQGVNFYKVFMCPHFVTDGCECRKPKLGMVQEFLDSTDIDLAASFMYGDRDSDGEFAKNIGVRFIKAETNGTCVLLEALKEGENAEKINSGGVKKREAQIVRKTNETQIEISLNLDGTGKYEVDTDIGFLSHMLELFAKHGLFDMKVTARGDTEYDDHHLIEDVGIALGQAIKQAVGNKKGIKRYGFMLLPMDEVLVSAELDFRGENSETVELSKVELACATDLSGRYAFETNYVPVREMVNDFATEMVKHFFKSLALNAEMNLHLQFLNPGENEHHRIEGMFKAFARSLRTSCEIDTRGKDQLASTKGML
jgi:imidazoleglycerol-phosphate dehydratase/histidinol-phosphatase